MESKVEVCKELVEMLNGDCKVWVDAVRVLAFAAAQGKMIQDFIASSCVVDKALEHCLVVESKFPVAIFRLLVNITTQNTGNQEKYLEKVFSHAPLFSRKQPECYKLALMALYNTFVTNPKLPPVVLSNKQALRWYKAAFDFIQSSKSIGVESEASEKEYAELYEWFTMFTFFLMKSPQAELCPLNMLFGCLIDDEAIPHIEDSITLARNSSGDNTVIQPCLLQSRFIQFVCSEIVLQAKEAQEVLDKLSEGTVKFLCLLFKALLTTFRSSYDILKAWSDSFLSLNFTQDFQNLVHLLAVDFLFTH